jgi:nitrite reductase/ring-hydroxylating ferredoxin subunit
MNIPGFNPDVITQLAPAPGQWRDVSAAKDVPNGEVTRTECEGRSLFVYREKQDYQVFDSHCPHQSTDITQLAVKGTTLTCPKHQWEFDAKSGDCVKKGNTGLKRIEAKVVKGRLLAFW